MIYKIFTTEPFNKLYQDLDGSEQQWIEQIKKRLEEAVTGKILHFAWLREKRNDGKRLYYLIEEQQKKILLVAFTTKKEQQKTINEILAKRQELFYFLRSP